jgi:hypothetical protein
MPSFNLPDVTIKRLVTLIRMLDVSKTMQPGANDAPEGSSSAAPAHAAPPPAHAPPPPKQVGR